MQRFLISVSGATILSWLAWFFFAAKTGNASVFPDLVFSGLLFLASSFTISLILYFGRLLISKLGQGRKIKFEDQVSIDLKPIWRRSFKMAVIISAFIAILAFLQLEELLTLFNLSLLAAIIILGSIWLRR